MQKGSRIAACHEGFMPNQGQVMEPLEKSQLRSTKRSATYKWLHSWRRKCAMPIGTCRSQRHPQR